MVKKTKYILAVGSWLLASGFGLSAFAQTYTVTPTLIGSTGNYTFVSGFGSISSSVGEPMVTTVSSGSVTLTQGFQQPEALALSVVASATDSVICAGSNTILMATASGGGPYTYNWTPVSGLVCSSCQSTGASPMVTTTYTITVTHTVNTATATVTITVNPTPTVSISGSNAICLGNSTTLYAIPSGGVTYSWSTFQTTQSIGVIPTVLGPNVYSVTATNSYGCSATATHTVNVSPIPIVSIAGGNTGICAGSHATLTASGGNTYSWSTTPIQTTPTIVVSPTATTSYTVFVTNSGGCSSFASTIVAVNSSLIPSISATGTSLCPGTNTSITISASGGTTYSWWPGGQTSSFIIVSPFYPFGPHTYSVVISNGNCSADTSITITVLIPPNISVSASFPVICIGDADTLTASGGVGYYWGSSYGTSPSITVSPTASSTYTVIGQGSNGCFNMGSVNVSISNITVNAGTNITVCPGFTAPLSATAGGDTTGLSYEWFLNSWDTLIQNSNSATMSVNPPRDSTLYIVGVYNTYGCWNKDTMTVFFEAGGACGIHIFNGITPNGDGKNDAWDIDGIQAFPHNDVSIFNRWGDKVWEGKNYDNDKIIWKGTDSSGQKLPSGTYYYVVELISDPGTKTFSGWVELTR